MNSAARRLALALSSAAIVLGALLLLPAPAGAFITGNFGLQQRKPVVLRYAPLQYHKGPVIHSSDSYAIYWDPYEFYNPEWMRVIDKYFRDVGSASGGSGNVFALNAQYGETGYNTQPAASAGAKEAHAANQSTFRGAYTDTDPYPPAGEDCTESSEVVCLTDQSIKTELQKVISSGELPGTTGTVPGAASTPVYYMLTPPGVTVCAGTPAPNTCSNSLALEHEVKEIKEAKITHPAETGICGYHSTINPGGASPIVYAVQPWVAGYAGYFVESESPLKTAGTSADVLACQDNKALDEPNQQPTLNPFAQYGSGLADVIVGDLADEQSNIVVDPLLNGWYQNAPTEEHGYPEQGDMCQWNFDGMSTTPNEGPTHANSESDEEINGGSYFLHWAFNSSGLVTGQGTAGCWQGASLEPHITAPTPVNVGDVIGLNGDESTITLDAAPADLRVGKEETRLAEDVQENSEEETRLSNENTKLGTEITKLGTEISTLGTEITALGTDITKLGTEEKAVAKEQKETVEEREAAEKGAFSKTEEEEFERTEKREAAKQQRIAAEKPADESAKKADEERRSAAEKEKRYDEERKVTLEQDRVIVTEDKALIKEEQKLADEHKLIAEREPFLAPIYKWDFGYTEAGHEVTEEGEDKASVFHAFPCAKTYTVGLTVVDGGGFEGVLPPSVTKTIKVEGKPCEEPAPAAPAAPSGGGSSAPASSSPSGTTGGTAAGGSAAATPGPVASAAITSRSLSSTLRTGLVIRYSINEQVAGHLEVLLAASIARAIGLHGPSATGLAKGTPAQIVIAKDILVTTKGGRSTLKIKFSKTTAARLRRLHKVSLMVRLVVRNAAKSPVSTTSVSTVTLTG